MMVRKRVMFVDDETLVLQGLARQLRDDRAEWDMMFVSSGAAALDIMGREPVDAIVTDMRMPGMSGAEVLNEVMGRWPATIRFILSGHSDADLIAQCVGSTHQYFSKPCEPAVLRNSLRRAFRLEEAIHSVELRRLVTRMDRVPSLPSLYSELLSKSRKPNVSLDEIGAVIERDLGMTAKVLQLVNSAFFGLPTEIASPSRAVAYLGLDTVRSLVLSLHAFDACGTADYGGLSVEDLWGHSLVVAAVARRISESVGVPSSVHDEAFVAGLLHDAGKTVLAGNFPAEYAAARQDAREAQTTLHEAETKAFGTDHAAVGGYLLGLWGLPVSVVEAVALHHRPSIAGEPAFNALTATHLAEAMVPHDGTGGRPPTIDRDYLNSIDPGLAARIPEWTSLARTRLPVES